MATNASRLGNAIVDRLKADGYYPNTTPAHENRSRAIWIDIADVILSELRTHQDIVLLMGDITSTVAPGTFIDSLTTAPITGTGIGANDPVTLSGKTT